MNGTPLILNDRIEIFPDSALPALNGAAGPAFLARRKNDDASALYALLCRNGRPIRTQLMANLGNIDADSIVRFLDWGIVDWPDGARYPILVFTQPAGQKLMGGDWSAAAIREDEIAQRVVLPVVETLRAFSVLGISHGAIHPGNLFVKSGGAAQLGECISAPPSYALPDLFLTIERGMAKPAARGTPTIADDLYALGMTALVLALGVDPAKDLDRDKILQTKINEGSFFGFMIQNRLRGEIVELLRGLLCDSVKMRWTLADVDAWLAGRRPHPKSPENEGRPSRPFVFAEKEYWSPRALAVGISANPQAATPLVENGEIARWIGRTFGNSVMASDVEQTGAAYGHMIKSDADHPILASRVAIVLDPPAPIRYKGMAVMPSGVGNLLSEIVRGGGNVQSLAELISGQIPTFWVNYQSENHAENIAVLRDLDKFRTYILRSQAGYGIERVLYESDQTCPCLSPIVARHIPYTIPELLSALDKAAQDTGRPANPIDRHVAAFLAARDPKVTDKVLTLIQPKEEHNLLMVGVLTMLGELQYRHGPASLPNLAAWLAESLEPAIARFRSQHTQDRIREAIKKTSSGNLVALLHLVDDPETLEHDYRDFLIARQTYDACRQEIGSLQAEIQNKDELAARIGRPIAVAVSVAISFAVFLGLLVYSALGDL